MITKTIEVELLTSNQIRTRPVHQWDTGQIIKITDATIPDGTAVQFGNRFMKVAYEVYMEGNQVTIPAAALQQSRDLTAYIVVVDEDSETTVYEISVPVTPKPKPEGYIAGDESENIKTLINSKASASGWTPNMYLGTDADGNMVTKDAPEGGGSGATEEQLQQIQTNASDIAALKTGKEAAGTAASAVSEHNTATDAHNDIRLLVEGLTTRLNALANSDDTTLDQMAEVVAYIKDNRSLIESITTSKVSVSDIVDNLTTNVAEKPLSAAQGVALKALIDAIPAGPTGKDGYTPVKGTDYWTDADKAEIVQSVIDALGGTVIGGVDSDNVITLTGVLESGTYTLKYQNSDGTTTDIGTITVVNNVEPSYENLVPSALDFADTSAVFNSTGYMDGAYLSSASPYYGADAEMVCTGLIPATSASIFYVKGVTIDTSKSHCRIGIFREDGTGHCYAAKQFSAASDYCTVETLGENYYKITLNSSYLDTNYTDMNCIALSAVGTGENLIVATTEIE